tara:strand:+ start:332 stop:736 length:405 start_codon:yes stop_codon:yes gene_type:complete
MSEYKQYIELESGSEKSFGIIFAVVFLLISLYLLEENKGLHLWPLIISLIFFLLAYLAPKVLSVPNKLWFKLGIGVGSIFAPVVMAVIYFSTVVPIGLIMKLIGKDLLRQKLDKNAKSYWIERNEPMGSMKDQF